MSLGHMTNAGKCEKRWKTEWSVYLFAMSDILVGNNNFEKSALVKKKTIAIINVEICVHPSENNYWNKSVV